MAFRAKLAAIPDKGSRLPKIIYLFICRLMFNRKISTFAHQAINGRLSRIKENGSNL
jgi:hypothetical protein